MNWNRLKKATLIMLSMIILSFLIIELIILFYASGDKINDADYIIILGAGLKGTEPKITLKNRLDKGINFLKEHPNTKAIVSGGQGEDELISEAEAMKRYLLKNGINEQRILMEDKSTSTYENLLFSKKLIGEEKVILIVTNNFHLFRSKLYAKKLDIKVYGLPSKTPSYLLPYYLFREYFAVLKALIIGH